VKGLRPIENALGIRHETVRYHLKALVAAGEISAHGHTHARVFTAPETESPSPTSGEPSSTREPPPAAPEEEAPAGDPVDTYVTLLGLVALTLAEQHGRAPRHLYDRLERALSIHSDEEKGQ
jgi:hypothetical protein